MSQRNEFWQITKGILLLLSIHFVVLTAGTLVATVIFSLGSHLPSNLQSIVFNIPLFALIGFGITQLLYVIPLVIYLSRRRHYALMKGVIIGAVLTALLNGGCWIYFMGVFRL